MNQSFSPNLDLMVSCPSNDPDHASDGIRAPEFISCSRETVGRSVKSAHREDGSLTYSWAKLSVAVKSTFAIVVQDEAVISH
jgi:hypothetical protein